jgi:hypothetical protein
MEKTFNVHSSFRLDCKGWGLHCSQGLDVEPRHAKNSSPTARRPKGHTHSESDDCRAVKMSMVRISSDTKLPTYVLSKKGGIRPRS